MILQTTVTEKYKGMHEKILEYNIKGQERGGHYQDKVEQENVFMKHFAPSHILAPKKGSSQKEMQLKL